MSPDLKKKKKILNIVCLKLDVVKIIFEKTRSTEIRSITHPASLYSYVFIEKFKKKTRFFLLCLTHILFSRFIFCSIFFTSTCVIFVKQKGIDSDFQWRKHFGFRT